MDNFFIIEHAASGDILRSYSGMDQATVTALVTASGNVFDFVDQATYQAKLAALPAK